MDYNLTLVQSWKIAKPTVVSIAIEQQLENGKVNYIALGSGVVIHPYGHIVTARHIFIKGLSRFGVEIGKIGRITTKELPKGLDLVVTFMPEDRGDNWLLPSMSILRVVFHPDLDIAYVESNTLGKEVKYLKPSNMLDLNEGDLVATGGFPLRNKQNPSVFPNLFSGVISCIHYRGKNLIDNLTLDIGIHKGNSGGPVFLQRTGELIGIVNSYRIKPLDPMTEGMDPSEYVGTWTNIVTATPVNLIMDYFNPLIGGTKK
jgi:S1-C subfamily serine protease